eukprot:3231206-Pyramimonas_sp.AAC.1
MNARERKCENTEDTHTHHRRTRRAEGTGGRRPIEEHLATDWAGGLSTSVGLQPLPVLQMTTANNDDSRRAGVALARRLQLLLPYRCWRQA